MEKLYLNLKKKADELAIRAYLETKKILNELSGMLATEEIGAKSYQWLEAHFQQQMNELQAKYTTSFAKYSSIMFEQGLKQAFTDVHSSFHGIPVEVLGWYDTTFKTMQETILRNYTADMMRTIKNTIMVGIVTGTPPDVLAKIIKKQIQPTAKRRITVLARDQLSLAMQNGIYQGYKQHEDVIKAYQWVGPLDKRTTTWCENRQLLTKEKPWTPKEVERYIEENPRTIKGKEIRASHGTFLHPHIQCRHRLVAITKSITAIVKE